MIVHTFFGPVPLLSLIVAVVMLVISFSFDILMAQAIKKSQTKLSWFFGSGSLLVIGLGVIGMHLSGIFD